VPSPSSYRGRLAGPFEQHQLREHELSLALLLAEAPRTEGPRSRLQRSLGIGDHPRGGQYLGAVLLADRLRHQGERLEHRLGVIHHPQSRHEVTGEQVRVADVVLDPGLLDLVAESLRTCRRALELLAGAYAVSALQIDIATVQVHAAPWLGIRREQPQCLREGDDRLVAGARPHEKKASLRLDQAHQL
jgi:hypothetical protein